MFDPSSSMLVSGGLLWDLSAPPDAEPLRVGDGYGLAVSPDDDWLATGDASTAVAPSSRLFPGSSRTRRHHLGVGVHPDGTRLVSCQETVRFAYGLFVASGERSRILFQADGPLASTFRFAMSPDFVVIGTPWATSK